MPSTDSPAPHDADTLYRLAEHTVRKIGVPDRWREDAVAEYVLAAYEAGRRMDAAVGNVQAYQCQCGHGAVCNFWRREKRQEALSPASCVVGAKRVSMDKVIRMRDGELVPMAETIEDPDMPRPDSRMLEEERRIAVERAVEELARVTRVIVRMVWLEDRTQGEAADSLGLSRQKVQRILDCSRAFLRERLEIYGDAYNRTRLGKNN